MANLEGEIGNIKTRLDNLNRQVNEIIDRLYTATRGTPVLETIRSMLVETRTLRIEMDSIKTNIPRLREIEHTRLDDEPTLEDDEFRGWSEVPISYNGQLLSSMRVRSHSLDTILFSLQRLINFILDNTARGQNGLVSIRLRIAEFNRETNELRRSIVSAIQQEERYLREITEIRQILTRQGRNPATPIRQGRNPATPIRQGRNPATPIRQAPIERTPSQSSEEYPYSDDDDWNRERYTNRNTAAAVAVRNPAAAAFAVRNPAAAAVASIDGESADLDNIPAADIPKMIRCPVCLDKIKDVRLNCGHLVCRECARRLKQSTGTCPECRQPITKTEIVYYNKYLKYKNKYLELKNKIK
jgi:hypothetical protein